MASNPPCMSDDGNAAVFTGTFFEDGTNVTVCPGCFQAFCVTIIEGMTGIPVGEILATVQSSPEDAEPTLTLVPDDDELPGPDDDTADDGDDDDDDDDDSTDAA